VWGCLTKVNIPINKKRKIGSKTVDYVFVRYSLHNTTYRFLVVNSKVSEISNDTIMESKDVSFLKMFFLWKINCLNLFVILLVLIYHLVVMLIRTLFFNLGGV